MSGFWTFPFFLEEVVCFCFLKSYKSSDMKLKLLPILISLISLSFQSIAQSDLLVAPTRVVFDGNKQKESLTLVNLGKDTATFSISFVQYNMKEDGSIVIIEKPDSGQMFADPYLRIFPRKVALAPGEPQVIMLQCRRKADMPAGECRSHLYFRAENYSKPQVMKSSVSDTNQLSVQLIPIYGISIPVIIRSGAVSVSSTLSDLNLEPGQEALQNLKFTINRTGNISVYGDIYIDFIPVQGKSYRVGTVRGVGVYTNINKRNMTINLSDTRVKPLTKGKLKVQYVSSGDTKRVTYAEAEMDIQK
jgi:hypothetical protein